MILLVNGLPIELLKKKPLTNIKIGLKQFGKIAFIRNRKARAVTGYGTVGADGSLFNSFKVRTIKGIKNIGGIFFKKKEYKDEDSNLIKKNK